MLKLEQYKGVMMFVVEEANISDIERLTELLKLLFSTEAEFIPNTDAQKEGLKMILEDKRIGTIFVLKYEEKIIGMVSLLWTISTALGGKVALLEDMIIEPLWQKKGCGSLLLEHAISHARKVKCKRITLLTDDDNDRAQRFYKRLGFVSSSMKPMRFIMD